MYMDRIVENFSVDSFHASKKGHKGEHFGTTGGAASERGD